MSGQTQRAFCLCFMHAAATFYIAHIFFINCKFRSEPRGIHELAVQCAPPWDRGLGQDTEGERGAGGAGALMLQQLRLRVQLRFPAVNVRGRGVDAGDVKASSK